MLLQFFEWGDLPFAFKGTGAILTREDVVTKQRAAVVTPECLSKLCHVDDLAMFADSSVQVDGKVYGVGVMEKNEEDVRIWGPHDGRLKFKMHIVIQVEHYSTVCLLLI